MTSNPDRCALGRQLLDRVVDAQLESNAMVRRTGRARTALVRIISVALTLSLKSRSSIVRSVENSRMMLDRWRSNPITFIETVLHDPETKKPFKLLPAERAFLEHAFKRDDGDHLLYPEQLNSCPKKSGKTTFAGIHALTTLLLFGGSLSGSDDLRERSRTNRRPCVHDDPAYHREQPPAEARG